MTGQSHGLAALLLDTAEQRFRDQGLPRVMITMLTANAQAERAYLKAGFKPYELTLEKPL